MCECAILLNLTGGNFQAMERLGDPVLKPFLQDVIQLRPLLQTMTGQMLSDPLTVPELIMHVGPGALFVWTYSICWCVYVCVCVCVCCTVTGSNVAHGSAGTDNPHTSH